MFAKKLFIDKTSFGFDFTREGAPFPSLPEHRAKPRAAVVSLRCISGIKGRYWNRTAWCFLGAGVGVAVQIGKPKVKWGCSSGSPYLTHVLGA